MSKSKIPWAEFTWNPFCGCPPPLCSVGCVFCWARDLHNKRYRAKQAGKNVKGRMYDKPFEVLQFFPELLEQPLGWKKPRTIFVNSMSDTFHPSVPFEWIDRMFESIANAGQHEYLFLTKRPERMEEFFQSCEDWDSTEWPNVHLGLTICNQQEADEKIPAAHRWLSIEPMLGEINLRLGGKVATYKCIHCHRRDSYVAKHRCPNCGSEDSYKNVGDPDWVVVGAESGPHARLCKLEWIESIVDQCDAAGVKYFVKQVHLPKKRWHRNQVEPCGMNGTDILDFGMEQDGFRVSRDPSYWPEQLRRRELI